LNDVKLFDRHRVDTVKMACIDRKHVKFFQGIYYQTSLTTEYTLFEAEPLFLILRVLILFLKLQVQDEKQ